MSYLDLGSVEVSSGPKKFVPGEYKVRVADVEEKETQSKTGKRLSIKFAIVGGEFDGYTVYHNFNIKNESAKAQEIGLSQLKTFMMCAGMDNSKLEAMSDLNGKSCMSKIGIKTYEGKENLEIKYFISGEDTLTTSIGEPLF
jgi:hypothetical protein